MCAALCCNSTLLPSTALQQVWLPGCCMLDQQWVCRARSRQAAEGVAVALAGGALCGVQAMMALRVWRMSSG